MGRVASLLTTGIAFSVAPLGRGLDALPSAGAAAVVTVVGFNAALGLEAFMLAQASINVPSTEIC